MNKANQREWERLSEQGLLDPNAPSSAAFVQSLMVYSDTAVNQLWERGEAGEVRVEADLLCAVHKFLYRPAVGNFHSQAVLEIGQLRTAERDIHGGGVPPSQIAERLADLNSDLFEAMRIPPPVPSPRAEPVNQPAVAWLSEPLAKWHAGFQEIRPFLFGNEAVGQTVLKNQLNVLCNAHVYPTLTSEAYPEASWSPFQERVHALFLVIADAQVNAIAIKRSRDPETGRLAALISGVVHRGERSDFTALYHHAHAQQVSPDAMWAAYFTQNPTASPWESAAAIRKNLARLHLEHPIADIDSAPDRAASSLAREWLAGLASDQQFSPQPTLAQSMEQDRRLHLSFNH